MPASTALSHDGPSRGGGDICDRISAEIRQRGYAVVDDVFGVAQQCTLLADLQQRDDFKRAGIGRQEGFQKNPFVRGDHICWLDLNQAALDDYRNFIEALRTTLNRNLLLGLFDYECHYAMYPMGTFYGKHVDAFHGRSNRRLSTVLYLNQQWNGADGGELILYNADGDTVLESVEPRGGRLVVFLSEEFPHEVKPARRERFSITGWYRINSRVGNRLDPPR